jgi:hypothetical protein
MLRWSSACRSFHLTIYGRAARLFTVALIDVDSALPEATSAAGPSATIELFSYEK